MFPGGIAFTDEFRGLCYVTLRFIPGMHRYHTEFGSLLLLNPGQSWFQCRFHHISALYLSYMDLA
jgi:hypothetical protein